MQTHPDITDMRRTGLVARDGADRFNRGDGSQRQSSAAASVEKIELTIKYMMENLNQPLKVTKLAALTNFSLSHFFSLFKRQTGSAPIDFFIQLRMRHARQLLVTTSLSVKQVAAALGYDDAFYFSRVFKSVYAVSPSLYRQQLLSESAGTGTLNRADAALPCHARTPERDSIPGLGTSTSAFLSVNRVNPQQTERTTPRPK
jgi:AraC-like DNA-binding protein